MTDANHLPAPGAVVRGNAPPSDLDAEGYVLSWAIANEGDIDRAVSVGLQVVHFYADANRRIWESIARLSVEAGMHVDIVSLAADLRSLDRLDHVGGTPYLAQLINFFPVEAKHGILEQHCRSIIACWTARQVISDCQVTVAKLYHPGGIPTQSLIEEHEQKIWELAHTDRETIYDGAGPIAARALTELAEALRSGGQIGVTTGFAELDKKSGGYQAGHLGVIAARTGMGKCLGRGTQVLRYDGTIVAVQDVQAGDLLMGPDSQPRAVLSTTRGNGPLWKISPVKGAPWVCNWAHVLTVVHTVTGRVTDIALDEYLKRSEKFRHEHKLFMPELVTFRAERDDLPIDPYVLGLWLGDGTKQPKKFQITKPDPEIRAALEACALSFGLTMKTHFPVGKCADMTIVGVRGRRSPLLHTMRELFPDMKNISIPQSYLTANESARLELLAGLVDTDGHLVFGCVEIVQKSIGIAAGIEFLARSLGMRVTRQVKQVGGVDYQRLRIQGALERIPTRIPRKKLGARLQKKNALRTGFSVSPVGQGEYFGFELDGDGRFLLGDFTVTHNSALTTSSLIRSTRLPKDGSLPVAVYLHSLEMPAEEVALRLVCIEAAVEYQKMRMNQLTSRDWDKLFVAAETLSRQPLLIGDKPGLTVPELRSITRKIKREIDQGRIPAKKLGVVAVDYLQLMSGDKSQTRELEVSSLTKSMKSLSKSEALCVIAVSQTNRAPEKKAGDKRPTLADLRESGAIENDADWVWFVYRDKYYNREANDEAEIIIAKQRGGATGTALLAFHGPTISFRPLERGFEEFNEFGDNVEPEDNWYDR